MLVVLDRDHPLAGEPAVALADLSDDAFLLSDGGCEPLLRGMYAAAGLELHPAQRVRDMATLLALVREQLGITIAPELALTDLHRLVALPLAPPVSRRLVLTTADSRYPGPIAASFLAVAAAHNQQPLDRHTATSPTARADRQTRSAFPPTAGG